MKTLILNGSPRINGDTGSLIHKITEKIAGFKHIFVPDFLERTNRLQNLKRAQLY